MALEMDTLATKTLAHTHLHTHTLAHMCRRTWASRVSGLRPAHQMKLPLCNSREQGEVLRHTPKNETFAAFVAFLLPASAQCPGSSSSSSKAHKCQLLYLSPLCAPPQPPCRCPLLAADAAFYELCFCICYLATKWTQLRPRRQP